MILGAIFLLAWFTSENYFLNNLLFLIYNLILSDKPSINYALPLEKLKPAKRFFIYY